MSRYTLIFTVLLVGGLFFLGQNTSTQAAFPMALTPTAEPPTNTPVPPTDTPVPSTDTPIPPTDTPIPPTNTPVPSDNTSGPAPTHTPVPPSVATATQTPLPPETLPETGAATPQIAWTPWLLIATFCAGLLALFARRASRG